MKVTEKYLYGSFVKPTDSRFEALGLPCDLRLFEPTACGDGLRRNDVEGRHNNPLANVWELQGYLQRRTDLFTKSDYLSLPVARVVAEYKAACLERGLGPQLGYTYLYSMEYRGWHHHFFRDEAGIIMSLAIASQFQSNASFLCIDGEEVLTLICEGNRPGERTEAYTGLSLEDLLPYVEKRAPLSLSTESYYIMEILGEGFESVVLKVQSLASGGVAALKLGKLVLEENYRTLQPILVSIQGMGISVPQYLLYDFSRNGILMEYVEGENFTKYLEQMERKQDTLFDLLKVYALCLNTLIILQKSPLRLSHGDAHDGNWLIDGDTPILLDFRYSQTIPFTSHIYQHRDTFAMLCTLYRVVCGKNPMNRQEVKQALMKQTRYQFDDLDVFPPLHHGNRYDSLLHQFLQRAVYSPQAYTLQDIAQVMNIYLSGFSLPENMTTGQLHLSTQAYE